MRRRNKECLTQLPAGDSRRKRYQFDIILLSKYQKWTIVRLFLQTYKNRFRHCLWSIQKVKITLTLELVKCVGWPFSRLILVRAIQIPTRFVLFGIWCLFFLLIETSENIFARSNKQRFAHWIECSWRIPEIAWFILNIRWNNVRSSILIPW